LRRHCSSCFLQNIAGDPTTNLYKRCIAQQDARGPFGQRSVFGRSVTRWPSGTIGFRRPASGEDERARTRRICARSWATS
jgi:hypothetical protein